MVKESTFIGNTFTSMSYIKHQAKLLHLNSENITIASEHITTMSDILEDVKVSHIDVVSEYGAAHSQSQMIERVDSFIQTL